MGKPEFNVGAAVTSMAERRDVEDGPTSRELVLGWCLWLLGCWTATLAIDSTVPAVRWIIFAAMCGLMVLWPAVRLSQDGMRRALTPRAWSGDQAASPMPASISTLTPGLMFRDWLCLNLVFQAVIWPLRITAQWTLSQTLWLDGAVAAWSLLTGLIIAWGCRSGRTWRRTLAMLACLALLLGEPMVMGLINLATSRGVPLGAGGVRVTWPMRVSPLEALWALTDMSDPLSWRAGPAVLSVCSVALAAAVGWLALAVWVRRGSSPITPPAPGCTGVGDQADSG